MAIVEAKNPAGETFYVSYGPMVTDKALATNFASEAVASRAIADYRGNGPAFWESEKKSAKLMAQEYRDWSFTVLP